MVSPACPISMARAPCSSRRWRGRGYLRYSPRRVSPTVEFYISNSLATQLSAWVGYVIPAYNDMVVYPLSGSISCPDLLLGLGVIAVHGTIPDGYEGFYPTPTFIVRHCNGVYGFHAIVHSSVRPTPPLLSTRTVVVSQFIGDPPGTLYAGGYDADAAGAQYRLGLPGGSRRTPTGQLAKH